MATPEFLFFDMGNVLLSFCHDRMCRQMAAAAGVEAEAVRAALFAGSGEQSMQWRFERGDFDEAAAFEQFCRAIGGQPDRANVTAAGCDIFDEMPESIALVESLAAAGNRLGIMSNTNPTDWAFVTSGRFPFLNRCFELAMLSFEARTMKPDRAIFEMAARKAGAAPGRVFFVDDKFENVAGALAAGLDAVLFEGAEPLREQLRMRGVKGA